MSSRKQWGSTTGLTDRSSTGIRSKALTIWRLCWWVKSPRRHVVRSYTRATTLRRSAHSGVPFSAVERRRCALASAFSSWRKKRGLATSPPVLSVANVLRPTSMPTCCSVAGNGDGSAHSHEKVTYHLPVLLRQIVAALGVPCTRPGGTTFLRSPLFTCKGSGHPSHLSAHRTPWYLESSLSPVSPQLVCARAVP